ncbi:MAG: hypothetical protein JNL77_05495 [Nitrosomonas sp.]|nr:hypothetical protein [Nitrosomonas sp.]
MKANKKILTLKIETTYGTDAVPVVGTDDILVSNFTMVPLDLKYAQRNQARPYFAAQEQIVVGSTVKMEFDLEMSGSGDVDAAPSYGPALRICALSETITPTTGPVTYAIISDGEESATLYFNWDGVRHKVLGARGNCEWRITASGIPYIHITIEGLVGAIGVAALGGTPDLGAFMKPLAVTEANTAFSLHGYAAALESLTINRGASMVYKNRPNSEKMNFTDGQVTGQVTIECPKTDAKDFYAICLAGTLGALAVTHGTAIGNKVVMAASNVQLTNPKTSEGDNLVMLAMDMVFLPSDAGNDELTYSTE